MASSSSDLSRKAKSLLLSCDHREFERLVINKDSGIKEDKLIFELCTSTFREEACKAFIFLILYSGINDKHRNDCVNYLHGILQDLQSSNASNEWNSQQNQDYVKLSILEILKTENPKGVCKKMWSLAAQIFKKHRNWPELIRFFCESLNSATPYFQDYAILFFLELPICLRQELRQYVGDLCFVFWNIFDSSNGERRANALAALINLVQHMSCDFYYLFDDVLMSMVKSVSYFLKNDITESNARRILKKLGELSRTEPRLFDQHLDQVFKAMVKIGVNDMLEDKTRYLAIEMMYYFDDAAIERVNKRILGKLFDLLSSVIPDICIGETFMRRITWVWGKEIQMPLLLKTASKDMVSSDWRKRYLAVAIIGVIAKRCAEAMRENIAEVMNVVTKSMSDPSPCVLTSTTETVKAMARYLPLHTLDQHADFLITWLDLPLGNGSNPTQQVTAVSAMHYLCERCSSCIIEPLLETVVRKLLELLQSEDAEVQTESLNTLTSFAKSSKDLFCQGYDSIITSLKKHLAGATTKSLRDNYVECILTVGMAVGKDLFNKDAAEVVALLLSVRWYLGEDDYSFKANLIHAWEHLFICLGCHFYPYMKDLMPDLLRSARLCSNSAREHVILKLKLKACKFLLCLTKEFKGELFPWIDQVSDILLSLVKFHDRDIRKIAFSVMPKLLLSAKLSIEEKQAHGFTNSYLHKLVLRFVPCLLEALDEETDGEVCAKILKSLTKCIEIAGGFLSKKKIQQTANAIEEVLKAISRKHFSQEEAVTDLEQKIIGKVIYYIRKLMEIYVESSTTFINKLLECLKAMMSHDATEKEGAVAAFTFCEICLKCDQASLQTFLSSFPVHQL